MKRFYRTSPDTLLELADQLPPNICRLIARENKRGMTNGRIAELAGMTEHRVAMLSMRKTWKGLAIEDIDAFRRGCGITVRNAAYQLRFMARSYAKSKRPLRHLEDNRIGRKLRKKIAQ
jgi:hypothetical protein